MYDNWINKLTESYINSKIDLTESEMILEELNETKEYAYILEHVLNTLLEHEVINEEIIMEVLNPDEVYAFQGAEAANARGKRLHKILKTLERLQKEPLKSGQDPFGLEARIKSSKIARASEIIDGAYEPNLSDRIDSGTVNPSSIEKIMRTKAKQGMLPAPHWSSIEHAKNMARTPYEDRAERKKMYRQDYANYKKQQGN